MARILIVDDEEMDRVLISEILVREGHEPLIAPNGQAALKIWKRGGIDVVVTDIVMPELDGLELLEAIREDDPSVPVIAVSGITARKLNEAARSGAHAILTKPVDPGELVRAISSALGEPDSLDGLVF